MIKSMVPTHYNIAKITLMIFRYYGSNDYLNLDVLTNLIVKSSKFKYNKCEVKKLLKELDNTMIGMYAIKIDGDTLYVY